MKAPIHTVNLLTKLVCIGALVCVSAGNAQAAEFVAKLNAYYSVGERRLAQPTPLDAYDVLRVVNGVEFGTVGVRKDDLAARFQTFNRWQASKPGELWDKYQKSGQVFEVYTTKEVNDRFGRFDVALTRTEKSVRAEIDRTKEDLLRAIEKSIGQQLTAEQLQIVRTAVVAEVKKQILVELAAELKAQVKAEVEAELKAKVKAEVLEDLRKVGQGNPQPKEDPKPDSPSK